MNAFVLLKRQIFNLLSRRLKIAINGRVAAEVYTQKAKAAAFGNFLIVYILKE